MKQKINLIGQGIYKDKLNKFEIVLSFLIPIYGVSIYISNRNTMPLTSKSAAKAALWGLIIQLFICIINFL